MILTVTPSGEGHPAHHFLWSKDQGSSTPPSYGKTFKMSEPHRRSSFTYRFETYSTSAKRTVLAQIFIFLRQIIVRSSPFHRLIARPIQLCLRCDAPLVRLSAPARCQRIKPKAYHSTDLPPKAWWGSCEWWFHLVWARI